MNRYLLVSLILISSCTKVMESETEMHPLPDRLPYNEENSVMISKSAVNYTNNQLQNFLKSPNHENYREIALNLRGDEIITELENGNLIFAGKSIHQILLYDLLNEKTHVIASSGRGPGDVLRINDVVIDGDDLLVSMEDGRLSKFECNGEGCEYISTILLEANLLSVSKNEEFTYLMRASGLFGGDQSTVESYDFNRIMVLRENKVINTFGEGYDFTNRHMMRINLDKGLVAVTPNNSVFASYKRFPFIYQYDTNGKLTQKYQIDEFIQGYDLYFTTNSRLRNLGDDYSEIVDLVMTDNGLLVIVQHSKNRKIESQQFVWDVSYDYYETDFNGSEWKYLGSSIGHMYHILNDKIFYTNSDKNILILL